MANTNQSVEVGECLSSKENGGSGETKAQVCCCRFSWEETITYFQLSDGNSKQDIHTDLSLIRAGRQLQSKQLSHTNMQCIFQR